MKDRSLKDKSALLESIQELREKGSKGHKRIAEFLTEQAGKAAGMTAAVLASETGVSEPTVVRFARELGYDGYPEFQAAFRNALKNRMTSTERLALLSSRKSENMVRYTLTAEIRSLKETLEATDERDFSEIVSLFLGAGKVYVVGNRSSTALADYFYFYASLILDNVHLVQYATGSDVFEQMIRVGAGDVVFGITFPRYSRRTVDAMTFARNNGAATIAMTDSELSPVVPLADKVLFAKNDVSSFVDSLVAPMALLNALISALGAAKEKETASNLDRLEQLWEEFTVYDRK